MDEQELTQAIKDIINSEELDAAQDFLTNLYQTYSRFHQTSNRVLRVLRQFMPNKRAHNGLAECILGYFDEHPTGTFQEVSTYVHKEFEYAVTNKSISDSLYRLKKVDLVTTFYDRSTKSKLYKKVKHACDNLGITLY